MSSEQNLTRGSKHIDVVRVSRSKISINTVERPEDVVHSTARSRFRRLMPNHRLRVFEIGPAAVRINPRKGKPQWNDRYWNGTA
jgi:hypothetical protein